MSIDRTRYIPVSDWDQFHPWPKVGGLRHLIFHSHENDFDKVIVRAGRRVLIDEEAFFNWMNERKNIKATQEMK